MSSDAEVHSRYGRAPEFTGISAWLNSPALRLADLKGRVVLIEFWTHECVNCLRSMPYVVGWYEKYKEQGFVVIGVHTPENRDEDSTSKVRAVMEQMQITFPVAQDDEYSTWKAYDNQFWPASYLIDAQGRIVYRHYGEGQYEQMEDAINALLARRH